MMDAQTGSTRSKDITGRILSDYQETVLTQCWNGARGINSNREPIGRPFRVTREVHKGRCADTRKANALED